MLPCFAKEKEIFHILRILHPKDVDELLKERDMQGWAKASGFSGKTGQYFIVPHQENHNQEKMMFCAVLEDRDDINGWAGLISALPAGTYALEEAEDAGIEDIGVLAWAMENYSFDRFRTENNKEKKILILPKTAKAYHQAEAISYGRDLINLPANILTPDRLEKEAKKLSKRFSATCAIIRGKKLLEENYPLIYTVGQAASQEPRLVDIRWGDKKHSAITLVGKGVCFDTGGLDLKPSRAMEIMQKDMGGSAHVLSLAQLIMGLGLPVYLRVLIPIVENSVSATSMRPGDIYQSRQGKSVEIGNTDAEGRLILADALFEASCEKPSFLIDFATLTGAARIATGPALPNLFSSDLSLGRELVELSHKLADPLWLMPLWQGYRPLLKGRFADLTNAPNYPYAGSITAALFLQEFLAQEFVESGACWMHIDVMAWNIASKPGFPKGGEIQGIRVLCDWIEKKFCLG